MGWLILELSDASQWERRHGGCVVPAQRRPSMLQPSRETAEQEALRLARSHPGHRFVVFQACSAAITVKVPSHITVAGQVFAERAVPTLVDVGEPAEEVPF